MSGIFISYRRDDTAGYAGRLYDALIAEFGKESVFIDVDSIHGGENFVRTIDDWIASSSVVLVLIGKGWLNSGGAGSRRLDDAKDFVRMEVASALQQDIHVMPVLVGGAKMPGPGDLPEALRPLAFINAVEIFDPLFHDSVRHLIEELRPLVPANSSIGGWRRRGLGGLVLFILILLAAIAVAVAIARWEGGAGSSRRPGVETLEPAPNPADTLTGVDQTPGQRIKVTTAGNVSEPPPVVEGSRGVMLPGSSFRVTGPSKPHILWRASVTVGDAWSVVGIASDGTVYLYDNESKVVDAVRDGREVWAHPSPSPLGFDDGGRLWLQDFSYSGAYSFNSRGEGGHVTGKRLVPGASALQLSAQPYWDGYSCRDGKVSTHSRSKQAWSVDLDGNCGRQDPVVGPQGKIVYVTSDAGTLYAITPGGQVLWTVKQACKDPSYKVYPISQDDVVVACSQQALYALRGGKPRWTSTLGASGEWLPGEVISDTSGNIYLGGEKLPLSYELIALDEAGKQRWKVQAGTAETPQPVGFDSKGNLYVVVSSHIVALSQ